MTFQAAWTGRTIGVNDWHRSTTMFDPKRRKHFSRIYVAPAYHRFMEELAISFLRGARAQGWTMGYDSYVDLEIEAWLWKMKDSDGIEKPLCDALQHAGIITNDRLIRNKTMIRGYHRKNEQDSIWIHVATVSDEDLEIIQRQQKDGYKAMEKLP